MRNVNLRNYSTQWFQSCTLKACWPVEVEFLKMEEKHIFTRHAKDFKQAGIKWDDDLTRKQQKERQDLSKYLSSRRYKQKDTSHSLRVFTEVLSCRQYKCL